MKRALLLVLPLMVLGACVTTTDRVVDKVGAAQDYVSLGVHYLREGNLPLAKEKLDRAEQLDPKNTDVYWTKAFLYEQLNQPKEAGHNYQKAMGLAPDNLEIVNTYASFLCKQGEIDRGLPMFDKLISNKLYAQPYVAAANAGMCLRDAKRYADSQRYFERSLVLNPVYTEAVVGLADLQISQGKPDGAFKTTQNYLASGSKNPDVFVLAVRAQVAQHECASAEIYARLLRRDFPNSAQASSLPQVLSICAASN